MADRNMTAKRMLGVSPKTSLLLLVAAVCVVLFSVLVSSWFSQPSEDSQGVPVSLASLDADCCSALPELPSDSFQVHNSRHCRFYRGSEHQSVCALCLQETPRKTSSSGHRQKSHAHHSAQTVCDLGLCSEISCWSMLCTQVSRSRYYLRRDEHSPSPTQVPVLYASNHKIGSNRFVKLSLYELLLHRTHKLPSTVLPREISQDAL